MNACAEGWNEISIVRSSDFLERAQPEEEGRDLFAEGSDDGITPSQSPPITSHVAARGSPTEEAFWALLERAVYIVW